MYRFQIHLRFYIDNRFNGFDEQQENYTTVGDVC